MTVESSKAKPHKVIRYILDKFKREQSGAQNMEFTGSDDAGKLAEEMMLMHDFWGTGKKASDRKYYHYKISFSEADRVENGGLLTPELAARYAEKFIHDHWRDYQVVWGVHADGNARHIHIVVNAVNAITGEKLRTNMQAYQQEKDDCQTLCLEMGLHAMDWREAIAEKHHMERTDGTPIRNYTIEESALKSKGVKLWKDELRQKIDNAVKSSKTEMEFKKQLEKENVTITRWSEKTVSFKLGDHKAVRGDTLGADYTYFSISKALEYNARHTEKNSPMDDGLDSLIWYVKNHIDEDDRALIRDVARQAGMRREEIDQKLEAVKTMSRRDKQALWQSVQDDRRRFWDAYYIQKDQINQALSKAYAQQRLINYVDWVTRPTCYQRSVSSLLIALIITLTINRYEVEQELQILRDKRSELFKTINEFQDQTELAIRMINRQGLPMEEYIEAIKRMDAYADKLANNASMPIREQIDEVRREALVMHSPCIDLRHLEDL